MVLRRGARGKGGRPPFDPAFMFNIVVLLALYSLQHERCEFQVKNRVPFPALPWVRACWCYSGRDDGVDLPRALGQNEGNRTAVPPSRCQVSVAANSRERISKRSAIERFHWE